MSSLHPLQRNRAQEWDGVAAARSQAKEPVRGAALMRVELDGGGGARACVCVSVCVCVITKQRLRA